MITFLYNLLLIQKIINMITYKSNANFREQFEYKYYLYQMQININLCAPIVINKISCHYKMI